MKGRVPHLPVFLYVAVLAILLSESRLDAEILNPVNINITKQEIVENGLAVIIELDQTASLRDFDNITRFIVVTPGVASANLVSNRELAIRPLKIGITFIHVWDNQSLMTIRLNVKRQGFKVIETEIRRITLGEERVEPIKFSYDFNMDKLRSRSESEPFEWKVREMTHGFAVYGGTPYGSFGGLYSYIFKKDQQGFKDDTEKVELRLANKFFKLSGGDLYTSFSEITLPPTHVQGVQFSSPDHEKKFKYSILAGSTGYDLWGGRISSFGQIINRFYGFRTEILPQEDISVFATYLGSVKHTSETSNRLGGIGATYRIANYLSFGVETTRDNKDRTAFSSSLGLDIDKFSLKTTYRDIGVDYLNITGYMPYQGRRGLYTRASFNPYENISMAVNFDVYQNRLTPDPDSVDKGNRDFYFTSQVALPSTDTRFALSFFNNDDRGQSFPVVTSGQRYEMNQTLTDVYFLGRVYGYAIYQPSTYKSYLTGQTNYADRLLIAGVRMNPLKGYNVTLQETFDFRQWAVRDYSTSPRRFEATASYGAPIGRSPVSISLYVGCQIDSHVNMDKVTSILGEDKIRGGAEFTCYVSDYFSGFLNAQVESVDGSDDSNLDRFQTSLYLGCKINWDTGIVWLGRGSVQGYVFRDANANGRMDGDEEPLAGVRVYAAKNRSAVTNGRGFYRIKNVAEGVRDVALDMKTLPKAYVTTTPATVSVKVEKMCASQVDFGVLAKTTINGFIFNDLNRNGVFDAMDGVLANVTVRTDDGKEISSNSYGYFTVYNVASGTHKVTVDIESVPKQLMPLKGLEETVTIKEGESKNIQFVFYALRTAAGRVYIDRDENGRYDEGEGMKGVELVFQDKSVVTDDAGNYIFRNFPAGKIAITINRSSLPHGLEPEKDIVELEMEKGQDMREGVDIKVRPKE